MKINKVLEIKKGSAKVLEMPVAKPAAGFVRVRQTIAPNCIEHRAFKTGFIEWHETHTSLGHEGVGVVEAVGPGETRYKVGDRVVIFQGWACGDCWVCENGLGATHCINIKGPQEIEEANNSESGGAGFCEYRLVPNNMLSKIPEGLSDKYASAANCLIGCTYTPVREHHITQEHVCVVGGVGFIGLATIVNLKYRGAKVIAIGRDTKRMARAAELGADVIINSEDEDWLEQIQAHTIDGRGADFSFECSGYPYYQQKCLDSLRHYGTMIQLGYAADQGTDLKWDLNTEYGVCWPKKTITASFDVDFRHRREILETLCDPWMQEKVDKLVTHTFPMSKAAEAFEMLNDRNSVEEFVGKVHLIPGE